VGRQKKIKAQDKGRLMRRKEEFSTGGKKGSLVSEMVRFLLCCIFTLITEAKGGVFLSMFAGSDD
jgi:hypothetical protein